MDGCFQLFGMMQHLFQTAFWVVLGVGVFAMVRRSGGRRRRSADPLTRSMSVLNERYARGDIDRDEYLERRAYLE